jgi:Gpi18-like mannosyltransferase
MSAVETAPERSVAAPGARNPIFQRPSVSSALAAFALSRALVAAVLFVTLRLPGIMPGARPSAAALASRGDASWYLQIARLGYEVRPFEASAQHDWAFFPLYPLLLRAAAWFTGEWPLTGVALSSVLFLMGLALVHELAVAAGLSEVVARRAALVTALWPSSIFFSYPTTEALFLAVGTGSLLAAMRGRAWIACALAGLAAATRLNGLVLLPVLALAQARSHGWRLRRDVLALALVPLGLVAFMAHLHAITGDALAFSHVQRAWGRVPGFFLAPLFDYVLHPGVVAESWNFKALNFLAGVVGLWSAVHWARRRQPVLSLYAALMLLLPLSSHSLQSLARYTMVVPAVSLAVADAPGSRGLQDAVLAVLAVALAVVTVCFAVGAPFAIN